jgi:uncharacterized damage-inducible protein DinB
MNYTSINDIFDANDRAHERLVETLADVSDEQSRRQIEGEKWTVAEIAEHIAVVHEGMCKICGKLMSKAQEAGLPSDDNVSISSEFRERTAGAADVRLEAPERVRPTGTATIAESLARMDANRERFDEVRPLFLEFSGSADRFPHPYFGDMTAIDWLVLMGAHEARHTRQIAKLLEK